VIPDFLENEVFSTLYIKKDIDNLEMFFSYHRNINSRLSYAKEMVIKLHVKKIDKFCIGAGAYTPKICNEFASISYFFDKEFFANKKIKNTDLAIFAKQEMIYLFENAKSCLYIEM